MNSASKLINWFLVIGKIEGYSYLILLFIAMPLKYIFQIPDLIRPIGMAHGVLFVGFMILIASMLLNKTMSFKIAVLAFLLSLIPFGTFYLKRLV
jgi:integral membrane protein